MSQGKNLLVWRACSDCNRSYCSHELQLGLTVPIAHMSYGLGFDLGLVSVIMSPCRHDMSLYMVVGSKQSHGSYGLFDGLRIRG